ncbi:alanyl-tRNA synthetase [Thermotoga maritima MSB8]|uniref:Alanine--tRNA ligase n=1 Tax=Thermotoga maritima (strain ATCC 43589 / DSM 3109 / JCM 10099 / NBRC 100826 / MSB8) TaxID=243274 RepID=SYA_THEMA|nr:alanine--tRNA ligase [Thermotoga maritima]Q9X1B6.1 RecName: Full=Alanine--tRNA ligase; AltName: Full=Alanyl-tRNA synthetase; Short=AlaRS [Thermotoga maritima MSB8]AAD36467.1 alanyl-tRNA synthetase [Thermotoga maritima MSB8]AGL50327.1 Alanyl-tRNA synthetase [Thermotoga maritima MSB8]AHD18708.1 alanyl-tRNA synthase [Thermotoga maritima MSB8]AKE27286.1 alanyl-tRNA synthetase [Thermotoga maritima]AKE29158.1 alanyl-tRNA synthetase [Thermotoga maritima MSB8]
MRYMTSEEIREAFLKFFEKKGHKILPSASLIPDDPQLLFTVAGMVPFKPIFWGKVEPVYTRVATCQKCLRTVDIENVGKTPRHHTFFEMLGNFSFGDYFKEEAIEWAWEFLTQVLGVPEEKLWVSVYEEDEEAFRIWNEKIGLPEKRILRMGKEDNFWGPAGPTGPCGPDTEIFYDTGYSKGCPEGEGCTPANSEGRFVEIWNLVFTEYYQDEEGKLHPLPRKNIDTGAGLERFCAMMQGVYSNFDTDLFQPIIKRIEELTGVGYKTDEEKDVSIRVIADHIRAITFLISEGVFPSNEGRGYVLRRIIRRAMRHGILLGMSEPFLYRIVDAVVEKMGKVYPEIVRGEGMVKEVLSAEENRFLKTLEQGMKVFDEIVEKKGKIDSEDAFRLYDTYGLPLELTLEIAKEKGVEVDVQEFNKYMEEQQRKSRAAMGDVEFARRYEYLEKLPKDFRTEFTGYEKLEDEGEVVLVARDDETVEEASEGTVEVVFSRTPFYAEKGGQVSDTGMVEWRDGKALVEYVFEASEGVIVHRIKILDGTLRRGQKVILRVDKKRREATMRNHTATHLLHAALKKVLGDHVRQAGSLVAPDRLRFDFTHFKGLSSAEIEQVEDLVNEWIMEAIPVEVRYTSYEEAVKSGVVALFTEKYGDVVRVVEVPGVSKELCGGTHVKNTGQIGLFKIISEESVSSGVRRIEAVTGFSALELLRNQKKLIDQLKEILGAREDELTDRVLSLREKVKELEKKLSQGRISEERIAMKQLEDGVKVFHGVFEGVEAKHLGGIADNVLKKEGEGIVILFSKFENKVSLVVKVSENLLGKYDASSIARNIAKELGGNGGGRKNFAQAGGRHPERIKDVLERLEEFLR